jgi:hypothetical protein
MKRVILPGLSVRKIDIFNDEFSYGDRIYDKASGKLGVIVGVKESIADDIELYFKLDGENTEKRAYQLLNAVYLGSKKKN